MAANRIFNIFLRTFALWMVVTGLMAGEHRGTVQSGGVPLPGVTVTATLGEKKVTTTTDDNGAYLFPNLEDGVWTLHIEMLGFGPLTKEVGIAPDAPAAQWEMKMGSADEIKSAIAAAINPPPAPTTAPTPAAPTTSAATTTPTPTAPATATPAPGTATPAPAAGGTAKPGATPATAAANGRGGRGQQNSGRPSLTQAVNGYQRVNVNATGELGSAGMDAAPPDMGNGDFGNSANDALVMNGSVSSGVAMPGQNDWGFGGRGGDNNGFAPGMPGMMGMGGPGGDPNAIGTDTSGRGGRGGGGPGGGGPGGGPGGRGGGGGGMGGFSNLNVGGGGGRGGGRGGAGGRGGRGPNANSFGNGRRGGRSTYNASLSFTLDNSALDAQNLSQTGQATAKPSYAKSSLTATVGGPLKIPHIIKTDKINFNLSYSLRRNRNANTSPYTLPSAAELGGDFSQVVSPSTGLPATIYDPTNGAPFPNDKIPTNRISSQALGLLQFYPSPNFLNSASRYNFQEALTSTSNQDNINTRLSGSLNAKNQLNGNFSWQRADGASPSLWLTAPGGTNWFSSTHQNAMNAGSGWVYHFTQRLISTLNYTFSRNTSTSTPYWANRTNLSGTLGITGNDQDPNFWGPPSISFSGGSSIQGLSDSSTTFNRAQTSRVGEVLLWIRGKHTVRGGGDFNRQQSNPISESNARGSFTFNGQRTSGGVTNGGSDFADFLLGLPYTSSIAYGNADKYFRNSWFDAYVTDDYKLTNYLTLSLGLRWDYQAPVYEKYGRLVNMAVGPDFTTVTPICGTTTGLLNGAACAPASQAGLGSALVHSDPHELQPRIGFAWRPFPKKSTVVRGGYGRYFNTSVYSSFAGSMSQQYPLSQTLSDSAAALPLTMANGFIRASNNSLATYALDPNFKIGYLDYWQLSMQQDLKAGLVATVTYSGNKGTHQSQQFIPNSAPQGASYGCYINGVAECPSNFTYVTSGANSNYESVTGQMNRRFRAGFSSTVTYTLAHMIDESGAGGRGGGGGTAQNWLDLNAERANSNLARRQALSMNMTYNTGQGLHGGALLNGWKGAVIKGWNLSTNLSVQSGMFETPSYSQRTLGGTAISGPIRGEYTGAPLFIDGNLNPAAFIAPLPGQYGNAGRDIIEGPTTFGMSASMGRTFRFGERRSADLRFDANNILNHVNFGAYNTSVGITQFGVLQNPASMRVFTATLRFRF